MNKLLLLILIIGVCIFSLKGENAPCYDVIWNHQSKNSSESMPCGGGDIGLNVWVEDGDVLFYISRSGTFDENNTLLKLGRIRLRLQPNPLLGNGFKQTLKLEDGYVIIEGADKDIKTKVRIWVDAFNPVVNIDVENNRDLVAEVFYENWRHEDRELRKNESNQNSYKWAAPKGLVTKKDEVTFDGDRVLFYHQNTGKTVYDATLQQQGLADYRAQITNPLEDLVFGGIVEAVGFKNGGTILGTYAATDYKAWRLVSEKAKKKHTISVKLHTEITKDISQWNKSLYAIKAQPHSKTIKWWNDFYQKSYIRIDESNVGSEAYEIGQNYQLFRYMLGCNAYGDYPTKFNGGLFTFDPEHTDSTMVFTPDYRKWGGGTHTAQNQRLVYFPMLRSGDWEMMKPQFDFYNRILPTAELRSRVYWGHEGACFTEQIENFGLPNPSEYGWKRPADYDGGLEYNAWLEYQWDTALEFCFQILEYADYSGKSIDNYIPLIKSTLRFFDEHYQYLANKRGRKTLTDEGKLILYPGSACETYKMAYNASSTIAALQVVTDRLISLETIQTDSISKKTLIEFRKRLPAIEHRLLSGYEVIAPAKSWERINNIETPQLYPVFPWGIYGIGKDNLQIALNTWKYDPDVIQFRSHVGWKQDAIWAARLGLHDEAWDLTKKKLKTGNHRFPAFWGPGFDWTPDHNWGGSGMIALQEMLLQADGDRIFLLPAWPSDIDVSFRLYAPHHTLVECEYRKGKIVNLNVTPQERMADLVLPEYFF